MAGSSTENPQGSTGHKSRQLTRACSDCRRRKRRCDVTVGHTPCTPCRLSSKTCFIPADRPRWKHCTTADEATHKPMGKAASGVDNATARADTTLWRRKRETKDEMPEQAERCYSRDSSDDNANPDVNHPELSIKQQIEQLNPAQTAELLFSYFAMAPGETHFLRSIMPVNMGPPGVSHGHGPESPSDYESSLSSTEAAKRTRPQQQYLSEEALLYYTFASAERVLEPPFSDIAYT